MVEEGQNGYFKPAASTTGERHIFNKKVEIIADIKPRQ
jgi:hypothetical protein